MPRSLSDFNQQPHRSLAQEHVANEELGRLLQKNVRLAATLTS